MQISSRTELQLFIYFFQIIEITNNILLKKIINGKSYKRIANNVTMIIMINAGV